MMKDLVETHNNPEGSLLPDNMKEAGSLSHGQLSNSGQSDSDNHDVGDYIWRYWGWCKDVVLKL